MKFIDLFAGIGGFHTALAQEGMECVFASEIDPYAVDVYQKNHGMKPHGDITSIPADQIPRHDVLCAGFPCQPFSQAGRRKGMDDPRGNLFMEIIRIALHHQPKIILMENVRDILTQSDGMVMKEIYHQMDAIGYDVDHVVLNTGDFGLPQSRRRVYFVAIRKNEDIHFHHPRERVSKPMYLRDVLLDDEETENLVIHNDEIIIEHSSEQPEQLKPIRVGYIKNPIHQGSRIYSINGLAVTLTASTSQGFYYVNGKVRGLHIDEAKKIMGFDSQYIVSKGIRGYTQLGNAVSPPMVSVVFSSIKDTPQKMYLF